MSKKNNVPNNVPKNIPNDPKAEDPIEEVAVESNATEIYDEHDQVIIELTNDLQRLKADFENYRKRVEQDKQTARDFSRISTIEKLLPTIDNITRATSHLPEELRENDWAQGVMKLPKLLDKDLKSIGVTKIDANPGTVFNPEIHEAVQMDEDAVGENEVVAEELQSGYMVDQQVIRPAMIKVTRK